MALTDEAIWAIFNEVATSVSGTLRQFVDERSKGDPDVLFELTEIASDALLSVVMEMRMGLIGLDLPNSIRDTIDSDASEVIWDVIEAKAEEFGDVESEE